MENYKLCKKCEETKLIEEFSDRKNSSGKIIKHSWCRSCLAEKMKKYRKENNVKLNKRKTEAYNKDPEKYKQRMKQWRTENINHVKNYAKEYSKEYYKKNREKVLEQNKINYYRRLKEDPVFRVKNALATNIRRGLKRMGGYKNSRTMGILGCSYDELKQHIESQFESWMSWDNYGAYNGEFNYGWDIDHIQPTSQANDLNELHERFHYTNLQPLCSKINRDIKKAS